jgi:hypothetical protein
VVLGICECIAIGGVDRPKDYAQNAGTPAEVRDILDIEDRFYHGLSVALPCAGRLEKNGCPRSGRAKLDDPVIFAERGRVSEKPLVEGDHLENAPTINDDAAQSSLHPIFPELNAASG